MALPYSHVHLLAESPRLMQHIELRIRQNLPLQNRNRRSLELLRLSVQQMNLSLGIWHSLLRWTTELRMSLPIVECCRHPFKMVPLNTLGD